MNVVHGMWNFHFGHTTRQLRLLCCDRGMGDIVHSWSLLQLRRLIACLGVASCLLVLSAHAASAQFYVRSPDVKKGVTAIEEHGALYSGPGEDERRRESHE